MRRYVVSTHLLRRPELGASALVVAAWGILLALDVRGVHPGWIHPSSEGMPSMPGMIMDSGSTASPGSIAVSGLPFWLLMTVAMMGPSALPAVRHTGLMSLRWRRGRAMSEFAAGYLGVWVLFGFLALALAAVSPIMHGSAALAVVLLGATAWEVSPMHRRCLRECHRSLPLPLRGWRAEVGAFRFGVRNGVACLGTCWCLMLVMVVAAGAHVLWTVGLAAIVTTEKLVERPRRASKLAALALVGAALAALAVALA
jgi:predicted metal-binding membrane protein